MTKSNPSAKSILPKKLGYFQIEELRINHTV